MHIPMNPASPGQSAKPSETPRAQSLPPEAHRLFQEAVGHHKAKRFQQAEAGYGRILSQFPAHADSLHLRGLLAYQQEHNSLAVTCIEQAIAQDPRKPHYHFNFGLVMEKEERWDDAMSPIDRPAG
jgi:tetratricopeptide (TPR) repeat protein